MIRNRWKKERGVNNDCVCIGYSHQLSIEKRCPHSKSKEHLWEPRNHRIASMVANLQKGTSSISKFWKELPIYHASLFKYSWNMPLKNKMQRTAIKCTREAISNKRSTLHYLVVYTVASGSGFFWSCSAVLTTASAPAFASMNWVSTLGVPCVRLCCVVLCCSELLCVVVC